MNSFRNRLAFLIGGLLLLTLGAYSAYTAIEQAEFVEEVIVDQGMQKISVSRVGASLWEQMLHPCEPPLTDDALIAKISVHYPHRDLELAGYSIPWIIAFLILTMIFGLIFGRMMKVSF